MFYYYVWYVVCVVLFLCLASIIITSSLVYSFYFISRKLHNEMYIFLEFWKIKRNWLSHQLRVDLAQLYTKYKFKWYDKNNDDWRKN